MIRGGHEARAPVAHAIHHLRFGVLDDDKGGQVAVLGAESVVHPRAEGWATAEDAARVHLADAARVIDAVRDAGAHDAEFIRHLCSVRQPVGDPQAALAVLLPFALVGEQRRSAFAHGGDHAAETVRQRLALKLSQQRLGIKQVELTGAAFHEEKNHALRLACPMREFGGLWHAWFS